MPTSTEVIRAKREEEAWAAQMAQIRASEAAKVAAAQVKAAAEAAKEAPANG